MSVDLDKPKTLKGLAIYAGLGALTLAWSTARAAKGQPVWPGFTNGQGLPPGAPVGAAETILFWPAAVLFNLGSKGASSASTTAQPEAIARSYAPGVVQGGADPTQSANASVPDLTTFERGKIL